jgi:hypothetical protein
MQGLPSVERYLSGFTKIRRRANGKRIRPCKPITIETRRRGRGSSQFCAAVFPQPSPSGALLARSQSHGEGSVGKDLKRLCSFCSSASLGDRVARIVGSLFLSQNLSVTALMSRAARRAGQCFRFPSRQAYRRLTSCRTRDRRRPGAATYMQSGVRDLISVHCQHTSNKQYFRIAHLSALPHGEGAIDRADLFDVRMTDYARLP